MCLHIVANKFVQDYGFKGVLFSSLCTLCRSIRLKKWKRKKNNSMESENKS